MKTKSVLVSLALSTVILNACGNPKWQGDISHLDEGWIQHQYDLIEENELKLEENPDDYEALAEIAFRYDALEDFKKAVKYYKKSLDANPDNLVVYNNLASIYEKVEEYDLAAENIMVYFQNSQSSGEAASDAVRILLKADDPENAQIALDTYASATTGDTSAEHLAFLSELKQEIEDYKLDHGLIN